MGLIGLSRLSGTELQIDPRRDRSERGPAIGVARRPVLGSLLLSIPGFPLHAGSDPVRLGDQPGRGASRQHCIVLQWLVVIDGAVAHPVRVDLRRPRQALGFDPVEESIAPQGVPVGRASVELRQHVALALTHPAVHFGEAAIGALHELPDVM